MAQNILLKGRNYTRKEALASGTITPGDLVEFGGAQELQAHSTVGGTARKAFAVENDLIGLGIDDVYTVGQTVGYIVCAPGTEILARLAATATCTKGQALESAGNGRLVPVSSPAYQHGIVAWAMATVAVAGSRVRAEVA